MRIKFIDTAARCAVEEERANTLQEKSEKLEKELYDLRMAVYKIIPYNLKSLLEKNNENFPITTESDSWYEIGRLMGDWKPNNV